LYTKLWCACIALLEESKYMPFPLSHRDAAPTAASVDSDNDVHERDGTEESCNTNAADADCCCSPVFEASDVRQDVMMQVDTRLF
jgi:hypothetical protein